MHRDDLLAKLKIASCMWCDKLATRYCDAVIGIEDSTIRTCDAPMCATHARCIGHVCGNDHETIDHCPLHAQNLESDIRELIMSKQENA